MILPKVFVLKSVSLVRLNLFFIVSILFFFNVSWAQSTLIDNSILPINKADQIYRADSAISFKKIELNICRLDSIQDRFIISVDSLRSSYEKNFGKIKSGMTVCNFKIDSLGDLNVSYQKYTNKLDSLGKKLIELKDAADQKFNMIKARAADQLQYLDFPKEFEHTVSKLATKMRQLQLQSIQAGLKQDFDFGGLTNPLSDIKGFELLQIGRISDIGGSMDLENLKVLKSTPLPDLIPQASGLQEQVWEISDNVNGVESIDRMGESALSQSEEVNAVLEQVASLPHVASPKDQVKEELTKQVKALAFDHFAGKQKQLEKAMDAVAKYKAKFESVDKISNLPKKLPNEMKGKPFIERLVPGIALQIHKKGDDIMADFNPYVGYRLAGRITSGIGWNQRVAYNVDNDDFNSAAKIYGPRMYSEFKLGKGFSPRIELEVMNTKVPPFAQSPSLDPENRQWVWGAFFGIKKDYRITKRVKGTASVMMRLFNPENKSPYADVVNARIGFEFPQKKKSGKKP